jgi:hypothetical protein
MTFSSEQVFSYTYTLDGDPGADDKALYVMKAPRAMTILSAYVVSANTQNAGTAVTLALQNWGAAGTAVEGTICAAVGGTATAAVLTANTPEAATVTAAQAYVDANEWLVLSYQEEGAGWIATDRYAFTFNYVLGKGA